MISRLVLKHHHSGRTPLGFRTSPRLSSLYGLALLSISLFCSSLSCNEELPPYREPEALLTATLDGEYWLSDTEHSLRVYIRVKNIYEETLEGPAALTGTVNIVSVRDPSVKKTLTLGAKNLTWGDYSNGILRIDPKSTITLQAVWLFPGDTVRIDDGRDIAHVQNGSGFVFLNFVNDSTCRYRKLARPEDLLLDATLTVFSKKAPIVIEPVVFPFCFISNWVSTKMCPHIATIPPCGYWKR